MADITSAIGGSIPNPAFTDVYAFITSATRYEGLKKYSHRIGKDRIVKQPFVMCVRTSMLRYLQGLSKKMDFQDGLLVYSFWSGYRENDDMKHFLAACKSLGLKIVTLHTSGHADYASIKRLVDTVNPDEIIPIHTEAPEKMVF
jgi:ribonuclease J